MSGETELIKYEAARKALAEARTADEVLNIHDVARAMRVAAIIVKDRSLEIDAWEIRQRAEKRLGELIQAQKATEGLNSGTAGKGRPKKGGRDERPPKDDKPTLKEAGISKDLSSRAQKLAQIDDDHFDNIIKAKRDDYAGSIERIKINLLEEEPRKPTPRKPGPSVQTKKPNAAVAQMDAIAHCIATVRRIVFEHMDSMPAQQWPDLFTELRDEIDDIQRASEGRKSNGNGHHAQDTSA